MLKILYAILIFNQFISIVTSSSSPLLQINIISLETNNDKNNTIKKQLINHYQPISLTNKTNWQLIHTGSENIYFIKNMKSKQITLQSDHTGNIFISKLNLNSWYQKWRLIKSKPINNSSYYLQNVGTGRQLDTNQGSYLNTQPPNENNNSQKWFLL